MLPGVKLGSTKLGEDMASKSVYFMKSELMKHNICVSDDLSVCELKELFNHLPITSGQIEELKLFNITYKEKWGWDRGFASEIIEESIEYVKLRNNLPMSPIQKTILLDKGKTFDQNLTSGEAAKIIYNLDPDIEQIEYIKKHNLKVSRYKKLTYGYAQEIIAKREQYLFEHRLKNSGGGK